MIRRGILSACSSQQVLRGPSRELRAHRYRAVTPSQTRWISRRSPDVFSPGVEAEEVDLASASDIMDAELVSDLPDPSEGPDMVGDEQMPSRSRERRETQEKKKALIEQLVPDPTQEIPHLPSPDLWKSLMPRLQGFQRSHRWFISNPQTASRIAEALTGDEQSSHKPITVVEGYPGPGIITRALLQKSAVEKVVAMELNEFYLKGLKNLQMDPLAGEQSSRLSILPKSCYDWATYTEMVEDGHLDHLDSVRDVRHRRPDYSKGYFEDDLWKQPSPLLFTAQMPCTVHSEQLFSQLLRAICHRLWLFRFGRVRLALLCSEHMASRCFAELGSTRRGKLTQIVGALADVKIVMSADTFEPQSEHVYPGKVNIGPALLSMAGSSVIKTARLPAAVTREKERQCLLLVEPKVKPLLQGDELDVFDYVTKHLFILRSKPIGEAISSLGAGAESVLRQLNKGGHPALHDLGGDVGIAPELTPPDLTVKQMIALTRLFDRWPFRPQNLFDEGNVEDISSNRTSM